MARKTDDVEDDQQQIRPFSAYLVETNKGRTHDDLSEGLHDLIAQVQQTGKKGTITLQVTVAPERGSDARLTVSEQVVIKAPKPDLRTSIFYVDETGNLTRRDPEQLTFGDLKPVSETIAKEAK